MACGRRQARLAGAWRLAAGRGGMGENLGCVAAWRHEAGMVAACFAERRFHCTLDDRRQATFNMQRAAQAYHRWEEYRIALSASTKRRQRQPSAAAT